MNQDSSVGKVADYGQKSVYFTYGIFNDAFRSSDSIVLEVSIANG